MNRNKKGFTLIELLIVVAIIGIIVAIAIPNLLNAIQRAKQKRTMADMRAAGTAAEAFAVDWNHYPPSAALLLPPTLAFTSATLNYMQPTYIKLLPTLDAWGGPLYYDCTTPFQEYSIASYGKDGAVDTGFTTGPTTDFNKDIVFSNGQFLTYPEGVQN